MLDLRVRILLIISPFPSAPRRINYPMLRHTFVGNRLERAVREFTCADHAYVRLYARIFRIKVIRNYPRRALLWIRVNWLSYPVSAVKYTGIDVPPVAASKVEPAILRVSLRRHCTLIHDFRLCLPILSSLSSFRPCQSPNIYSFKAYFLLPNFYLFDHQFLYSLILSN